MERNSFSFLKQFIDAVDTEDLTYEERCRAVYALCYYAIRGEYPDAAAGMDKMYVRTNIKLLEGQDKFKEEKSQQGSKGGPKPKITDEQIKRAYAELYFENGGVLPSEKDVIEKCGGGVCRINQRKGWLERNEYLNEMKELNECVCKNEDNLNHSVTFNDF